MATVDELEQALADLADLVIEPDSDTISVVPREDLDLLIEDGDLAVASGPRVIAAALVRRLRTPLGFYALLIGTFDEDGNKIILRSGATYGSNAGRMLSEPLTNDWIRGFVQLLTEALSEESRIRLVDIDVDIFDPSRGQVSFLVNYEIVGTGTVDSLTLETEPGAFNVVV